MGRIAAVLMMALMVSICLAGAIPDEHWEGYA